tara:strand:- start:1745 stop:3568 length:1824 start_codon:yes stop_codon:yes gene_type:complete
MTCLTSKKIAVLPGDGIGIEVTHEAVKIFAALGLPIELEFGDIGWAFWQREGNALPQRTLDLIKRTHATLLGAITSMPKREAQTALSAHLQAQQYEYLSPIIQLRQQLDLYANVRPCFNIKNNLKAFNLVIIRENTEGLYAGFDYHPLPQTLHNLLHAHPKWRAYDATNISATLRLQSQAGLLRLYRFAFAYADTHGFKRVTLADKPNVLRQSSAFAREFFEQVAQDYPHIQAEILNVDAVALWLVRRPEAFGVVVAENMFGDILSDVGAGVMGGLGFAPSANVGEKYTYFEPVHGSAPRVSAGQANPSAMFLTCAMLLRHLGYQSEACDIEQAVSEVVNTGKYVTYDVGGRATTADMASAIIDTTLKRQAAKIMSTFSKPVPEKNDLHTLAQFEAAEVADALDSLNIESVLLGIQPLLPGMKMVGPVFTVQYKPYHQKPEHFQNAGDYIDNVPKGAVILIDNDGRDDCSTWGDILTQVAIQQAIAGTVIHGACRDAHKIRQLNYPLFSKATITRSGKNRVYKAYEQIELRIGAVLIKPDDVIFADDNGVLVIPREHLPTVLQRAANIRQTEKRIIKAVQSGMGLAAARQLHRYDQPWLNHADKKIC